MFIVSSYQVLVLSVLQQKLTDTSPERRPKAASPPSSSEVVEVNSRISARSFSYGRITQEYTTLGLEGPSASRGSGKRDSLLCTFPLGCTVGLPPTSRQLQAGARLFGDKVTQ